MAARPGVRLAEGSVRAWLTTIAHNLAIDVLRARTSAPVDPAELPALLTAVTETPERLAVARDSAAGLRRALAQLPGRRLVPWRWRVSTA